MTPPVPVVWVKGANRCPRDSEAPHCGEGVLGLLGTCGQASPWLWRLTVACQQGRGAGDCLLQRRKQVPREDEGLDLGHTARQPPRRGPWRRGRRERWRSLVRRESPWSGWGGCCGFPSGRNPTAVSPHCRVPGSWSMPPVPAAAGPRCAGPVLNSPHAPSTSSRSCVWKVHQPVSRMRALEPREVMSFPEVLGHGG